MTKSEKNYRTQQIIVRKGHRLFPYFQTCTENAKNLYNTTNFYYRQVFTALKPPEKALQPLQKEVLDIIDRNLEGMNEVQKEAYRKALERESKKEESKRKEVKLNLFNKPNAENPYVNYGFLNALFKFTKQPDYLSLPIQSSQATMKKVFSDWKSFYESIKDYSLNPGKYTGKPRIPRYIRSAQKEVEFTNQDCVIKEQKYLKFPKTKTTLNIGKLGKVSSKLKCVRVIPTYGYFIVEVVFEAETIRKKETEPKRIMSIDLGVNNLATITTNTGIEPVLLKGGNIKSINQFYNKQRAHYYSVLRQGKSPEEGLFSSNRLIKLDAIRRRKMKDIFHKASFFIKELADFEQIDTIVIGKNKSWKQDVKMRKKDKQTFIQIPFNMLISMITYKANELGINVVEMEESYTSQASFLDGDSIPAYGEVEEKPRFSGKRIERGLYRSKNGKLINADVNGSANIMRKHLYKKGIQLDTESVCVELPVTYKII